MATADLNDFEIKKFPEDFTSAEVDLDMPLMTEDGKKITISQIDLATDSVYVYN